MILVNFPAGINEITIPPLTQWDYGQTLKISGLTLPEIVQVHFCDKSCEKAIVRLAEHTDDNCCVVTIPDELLKNPYGINVFIYVVETNQAETVRIIHIPIIKRTQPEDYIDPAVPTTQNKLEELIADVADLTNDFARVYGADGNPLTVQICDEKPSVQNANTLYIYPDVAIESRVAALETDTTEIKADAAALEGRTATLETKATSLDGRVTTLETDLGLLGGQVDRLEKTATNPFINDANTAYLDGDVSLSAGVYQIWARHEGASYESGAVDYTYYSFGVMQVYVPSGLNYSRYTEYSQPNQGYYLKIENGAVKLYRSTEAKTESVDYSSYKTETETAAYGYLTDEVTGNGWAILYRKLY